MKQRLTYKRYDKKEKNKITLTRNNIVFPFSLNENEEFNKNQPFFERRALLCLSFAICDV